MLLIRSMSQKRNTRPRYTFVVRAKMTVTIAAIKVGMEFQSKDSMSAPKPFVALLMEEPKEPANLREKKAKLWRERYSKRREYAVIFNPVTQRMPVKPEARYKNSEPATNTGYAITHAKRTDMEPPLSENCVAESTTPRNIYATEVESVCAAMEQAMAAHAQML